MTTLPFRPPARFTLATDARLQAETAGEDYAWRLHAAFGLWEAMALVSTLGLRVQEVVTFPFVEVEGQRRWAPETFANGPHLLALTPAWARLQCEPFLGLVLQCEYWAAHPQGMVGRLHLYNEGHVPRVGAIGVAGVLRPLPGEEGGLEPRETHAVHVLQGEGGGLSPVLFLTGGAEGRRSPFPALTVSFSLLPGQERHLTWVQTARQDPEAGFELARQLAARPWPPVEARLAVLEAQVLHVEAEAPARSWAFLRGRQMALRLLRPHPDLPHPFFVTARGPDHGGPYDPQASHRAPSVLDAYHLASAVFLPLWPEPVRGWVANFLARQQDNGFIPWKPTLPTAGNLASPLLVTLAYRAWQHDPTGLAGLYEPMRHFLEAWQTQADANRDGLPEWTHPLQMGLADPPGFAPWRRESPGASLSHAESPALYAFLFAALNHLEAMAQAGERPFPKSLQTFRRRLRRALNEMWDDARRAPLYRDRDTHQRPPHQVLHKAHGRQTVALSLTFASPQRLLLHFFPQRGSVRSVEVVLRGRDERGKPLEEILPASRVQWYEGRGVLTSEGVFAHLEEVRVDGLRSRDRWVLLTPDYTLSDISLLTALWAEALTPEQAEQVRRALRGVRGYGRPFGAPLSPRGGKKAPPWQRAVHLPWNALAVEGLLAYGFREDAARLLTASTQAVEHALSHQGAFFEAYHADTGQGLERAEMLAGLPAPALWMKTAGVHPLTPRRLRLTWPSPFAETLRFAFWGWKVIRGPKRTVVITPDGRSRTLPTAEPWEIAF